MKKSITLSPHLGPEVLNHLRQFGELPSTGILAGQAVDSALADLYGAGGGVYNDLDIFRVADLSDKAQRKRMTAANNLTGRFELHYVSEDYASMNVIVEGRPTYRINSVNRDGMLNFVNCNQIREGGLTAHRVLTGFDLNCTRVGVDLETGLLHWTKDYEQFLHSRQLRISMMHTPWHTFLRLAKKLRELPNVYADLDAAAEACVTVTKSKAMYHMMKSDVSLSFGKKHFELAEALRGDWEPYFTLTHQQLHRHRYGWVKEKRDDTTQVLDLWSMEPIAPADPAIQAKADKLSRGVLFFGQKLVDEHRRRKSSIAVSTVEQLKAQQLALGVKRNIVLGSLDLFGADYVKGQALESIAEKVARFFSQHTPLSRGLVGMSLAQQFQRMKELQRVARDFGRLRYEGDNQASFGVLEEASEDVLQSYDRMYAYLEADYIKHSVPFKVEPLKLPARLPAKFEGFQVKELLTAGALRREGRAMHHCVGGYSHAISSGRSRIISVRHTDEDGTNHRSTIELQVSGKGELATWRIMQNRTAFNKEPSPINLELGRYLLDYLVLQKDIVPFQHLSAQRQAKALYGKIREYAMVRNRSLRRIPRLQRALDNLVQIRPETVQYRQKLKVQLAELGIVQTRITYHMARHWLREECNDEKTLCQQLQTRMAQLSHYAKELDPGNKRRVLELPPEEPRTVNVRDIAVGPRQVADDDFLEAA